MTRKLPGRALFLLLLLLCCGAATARGGYRPLAGVIHVHSSVSSGEEDLKSLVSMAAQAGLEALIVTDHDRVVMEYGIFPFQGVIKRREEQGSITSYGAKNYLNDIARLNREQDRVLVLPGAQCSPLYYWTGNPWSGLTAHDFRKELLLIGMRNPEDYEGIPEIHGALSLRNFGALLPRALIFLLPLAAGIFLLTRKGRGARSLGTLLCVAGAMAAWSNHPFAASRFDAYHGDQGMEPFQEAINWAGERGGLVFWAHPESSYSHRGVKLGPVTMQTRKHPEVLLASRGYTGFCALYGDSSEAEAPGREWDRALLDYCAGDREKAAWAIAGADFHMSGRGVAIDDFSTVFLVSEKSIPAILDAMKQGRMYAVRKSGEHALRLQDFALSDPEGGEALLGQELRTAAGVTLSGRIAATDGKAYPVEGIIVKNGRAWREFSGETPLGFSFADRPEPGKSYYRLLARGRGAHRIVSNPVFTRKGA